MKKPYLIQRANFRKETDQSKKGIDKILDMDYMGSSEFEWGALPTSLKRIRASHESGEKWQFVTETIGKKEITIFCLEKDFKDVLENINFIAEDNIHLKEYSDFNTYIKPSEHFKSTTDFWWDIENDYMFWRRSQFVTDQLVKLILNPS